MTFVPAFRAALAQTSINAPTSDAFNQGLTRLHAALDKRDFAATIIAAEALLKVATTADEREIAIAFRDQSKVNLAATQAEQRGDYDAAIAEYRNFAKRWPVQAGAPLDRVATLERYQAAVPLSPAGLASGEVIADRMLKLHPEAWKAAEHFPGRSPAGAAMVLELRRMLRPLIGLDLKPRTDAAAADIVRFRGCMQKIRAAGVGRQVATIMARFSDDDPALGSPDPNSLLAFSLIQFTDRATQDAFGIHDPHE